MPFSCLGYQHCPRPLMQWADLPPEERTRRAILSKRRDALAARQQELATLQASRRLRECSCNAVFCAPCLCICPNSTLSCHVLGPGARAAGPTLCKVATFKNCHMICAARPPFACPAAQGGAQGQLPPAARLCAGAPAARAGDAAGGAVGGHGARGGGGVPRAAGGGARRGRGGHAPPGPAGVLCGPPGLGASPSSLCLAKAWALAKS